MLAINISHSPPPYINFLSIGRVSDFFFKSTTCPPPQSAMHNLSKMQFPLFFPYITHPCFPITWRIKFKFHRMAFKGHPDLASAISSVSCLGTLPLTSLSVYVASHHSGLLQDPASTAHTTLFARKLFPFLSLL